MIQLALYTLYQAQKGRRQENVGDIICIKIWMERIRHEVNLDSVFHVGDV